MQELDFIAKAGLPEDIEAKVRQLPAYMQEPAIVAYQNHRPVGAALAQAKAMFDTCEAGRKLVYKLGAITNGKTRPGALYAFLKSREGEWFSSGYLAEVIKSGPQKANGYISTVLSAVRNQLPAGETLQRKAKRERGAMVHRYRLVTPSTPPLLLEDR